jgi:hypothetical protein
MASQPKNGQSPSTVLAVSDRMAEKCEGGQCSYGFGNPANYPDPSGLIPVERVVNIEYYHRTSFLF